MQMACGEKTLYNIFFDLLGKFLTLLSELGKKSKKSLLKTKYLKKM